MCIAIYSPADKAIVTRDTLEHCARENPHGMGLAYPAVGDTMYRWRTVDMTAMDTLWSLYEAAHAAGAPTIIHFRFQTHGEITDENAHPFYVPNANHQQVFCHNGIIDVPSTDKLSDTRSFANHVLAHLRPGWLDNKHVRRMVERFIGGSKLLFLDAQGRVDILNESHGTWHEGVWYSNSGFRPFATRSYHLGWRYSEYDEYDAYWRTRVVAKDAPADTTTNTTTSTTTAGTALVLAGDACSTVGDPHDDAVAARRADEAVAVGALFGRDVAAVLVDHGVDRLMHVYCVACCPQLDEEMECVVYRYTDLEVADDLIACDACGELPESNAAWRRRWDRDQKRAEKRAAKRAQETPTVSMTKTGEAYYRTSPVRPPKLSKQERKARKAAERAERLRWTKPITTAADAEAPAARTPALLDAKGYPTGFSDDGPGAKYFFRPTAALYVYGSPKRPDVKAGLYCRTCCPDLSIGRDQTLALVRVFDKDLASRPEKVCRECGKPPRSLEAQVDELRAAARRVRESAQADALGLEMAKQAAEAAEARRRADAHRQAPASNTPASVAEVLLDAAAEQAAAHPETVA
jgi:hypothetical protein